MGIKLLAGKLIDSSVENIVRLNYKLTPFIPNGRILPLDIKRANITPRTIFDVGANIGQTANYFNDHFQQADIYSFEPVKATYQDLLKNTAHAKRVHCLNEALGEQAGDIEIFKSDNSEFSSFNRAGDERFLNSEMVHVNTGAAFCKANNISEIDLLKMDAEGYELSILKGFEPMLKDRVKMIYSEVGFDRNDTVKTYIADLLDYLGGFGFHTSNFYEPYRWGKNKLRIGFYNILLINTNLIEE